MDRNEYLEMCRDIAIFKGQQKTPIYDIPNKFLLNCGGLEYYPHSYKLWFDEKGNPRHTAVLISKYKHITECVLEQVKKC